MAASVNLDDTLDQRVSEPFIAYSEIAPQSIFQSTAVEGEMDPDNSTAQFPAEKQSRKFTTGDIDKKYKSPNQKVHH